MSWEILSARESNTCKYIYLPLNISSTWNSWTASFTREFYELCTRIDKFLLCPYFTSSQSHSGDHSPSKLLQQLEIKWHWRRQACEAQSIPPICGPGKKLYLAVVSFLFWLYFSLPLLSALLLWWTWGYWELTHHCYSSNTPTWPLPPTHDTDMDACCSCWEMALVSSLLALNRLVAFYRLVFSFFQGRNKCYVWRMFTLHYTGLHYVILYYIARMLLA